MSVDIRFDKVDRMYNPGDVVSGTVVVTSKGGLSHKGIQLTVGGEVSLSLSARSIGLFEAFYSSLKPVRLVEKKITISTGGKLPNGKTELPFQFRLTPIKGQQLFETYHGVYVNVQYSCAVTVTRGALRANLNKAREFIVHIDLEESETKELREGKRFDFTVTPDTLRNVKDSSKQRIPHFHFEGFLDHTVCNLEVPFTGEITVLESAFPIKSIELQLVRVESCKYMEGETREATEIQNIQIAEGNPTRNLAIPIHMIFPRLFTCSTTTTTEFKVEFEVNLIVLFSDNHLVTENFPIKLYRSQPSCAGMFE